MSNRLCGHPAKESEKPQHQSALTPDSREVSLASSRGPMMSWKAMNAGRMHSANASGLPLHLSAPDP